MAGQTTGALLHRKHSWLGSSHRNKSRKVKCSGLVPRTVVASQQNLLTQAHSTSTQNRLSRRTCLIELFSGLSFAYAAPSLAQDALRPEPVKAPAQEASKPTTIPEEGGQPQAAPLDPPIVTKDKPLGGPSNGDPLAGKEKAATEGSNAAEKLSEDEAKRLLDEEEERRKARKRKKGRLRELEEIRAELAEKQLELIQKEQELLEKEQTVMVLREELEIEKRIRALLTKEKEKAAEEAALAMGLCVGGAMLP